MKFLLFPAVVLAAVACAVVASLIFIFFQLMRFDDIDFTLTADDMSRSMRGV